LRKIVKIIGWIILLATFTSLGFATDNPKTGLIGYFIFFSLVFGGTWFYIKKSNRKNEINPKITNALYKILGTILVLVSAIAPVILFQKFVDPNLSTTVYTVIVVITIVLIALGALAISIINNSLGKKLFVTLLGYLFLIALAIVPALGMSQYSNSYANLGIAYWSAIVSATLAWWGVSLFFHKG
jgi:cation transport ATPase